MGNKTSFSSERQPTRRRGKSKRTKMLEVLKTKGWSEQKLWTEVLDMGLDGDSACMNAFLNRLCRPEKSTLPKMKMTDLDERFFDLSEIGQIKYLTWLTFRGEVAADQAAIVANMIATTSNLTRATIDSERLDAVEEIQEARKNVASGSEKNDILHKIITDSKNDAELLRQIAQSSMAGQEPDSPDSHSNNPQITIDEMLDNDEEPLMSVSLKDIVKGSDSTDDTETEKGDSDE